MDTRDEKESVEEVVFAPSEVKQILPLTPLAKRTVEQGRQEIQRILTGEDKRVFIVVGPCSIHDPEAALEYAHRLQRLAAQVQQSMLLVMRIYLEKPRTTVGWKGFITDPRMDDSCRIEEGIFRARRLLLMTAELGLATATEILDPLLHHYNQDLVSWAAIGARTCESQLHRQLASGLACPVGFKNPTDGRIPIALDAISAASRGHHFLGIAESGRAAIQRTVGNPFCHIVLRGGTKPNYDEESVRACEAEFEKRKMLARIMVDCSHGNSQKVHTRQPDIFADGISQRVSGRESIIGFMLESHLFGGNQDPDAKPLRYGVSITDACIDWQTTEESLLQAHEKLMAQRRA